MRALMMPKFRHINLLGYINFHLNFVLKGTEKLAKTRMGTNTRNITTHAYSLLSVHIYVVLPILTLKAPTPPLTRGAIDEEQRYVLLTRIDLQQYTELSHEIGLSIPSPRADPGFS